METNQQFVTAERFDKLSNFLEKISKRLTEIETSYKKISKQLERNSDDGAWEGFGPKPEQQPFNPNAETYTLEVSYGPQTIRRDDGEDDNTWAGRKKCLMNRRVLFLNSSGVVGTPEQEAYLKEIYDRLTAHGR